MGFETLHDFPLKDIEVITKTIGFEAEVSPSNRLGPDAVLRYVEYIVVYVESKIYHDTSGSESYFSKIIKQIQSRVKQDQKPSEPLFLIITLNTSLTENSHQQYP